MAFFYHSIIRKNFVAFMSMFDDIHINRFDSVGALTKDIKVPISFDMKHKMVVWVTQIVTESIGNVLPRLSVQFNSIQHDPDRRLNPFNKLVDTPVAGTQNFTFQPAPYNIGMTLTLWTIKMTDALQIIEQVAQGFNPKRNVTVNEFPLLSIAHDVEVILENISPEMTFRDLTETDERVLEFSFDFIMKTHLYPELGNEGLIETIELMISQGISPTKEVELVTITEAGYTITDPP